MIELIEKHLTGMQLQFYYEKDEENRHSYYFDMKLKKGNIRGVIGVNYSEEYVLLYFLNPTPFPEEKKHQVGEFLHRVNYNIPQGAFVIDYNDYIVGFHTTFSLTEDETHNNHMFIEAFKFCKDTLQEYFPGVLRVGYGEVNAETALNEILHDFNPRWN